MNCMKCGREITEKEAFCAECLRDMQLHPVKPGTVIFLPTPQKTTPKKPQRKKKQPVSPEEQVVLMKKHLLASRIISFILAILVCGLIFISKWAITELDLQRLLGQNYTSITDILDADGDGK